MSFLFLIASSYSKPENSEKTDKSKKEASKPQSKPSSSSRKRRAGQRANLYQISELLKKHLQDIEKDFSEIENAIIKKRLLKDPPSTLQKLADEFHVTREAIRQREGRLMEKLSNKLILASSRRQTSQGEKQVSKEEIVAGKEGSPERAIYEALHFLFHLEEQRQEPQKQRLSKLLKQTEVDDISIAAGFDSDGDDVTESDFDEGSEDEDSLEETSLEETHDVRFESQARPMWELLAKFKNISYLRELFEREEELLLWIREAPEPLYFAIQSNNRELLKFLVEELKVNVQQPYGKLSATPLHAAIISQNLAIIEFFLEQDGINFAAKDIFGENLFHYVFLGSNHEKMLKILNLLFSEKHFSKVSSLLNAANNQGETALDLALRENKTYMYKKIINRLLERGAVSFKLLPQSQKAVTFLRAIHLVTRESRKKLIELIRIEMKKIADDMMKRQSEQESEQEQDARREICLEAVRGFSQPEQEIYLKKMGERY